jgi:asparagine synthase (glutamine-hydrolysing)
MCGICGELTFEAGAAVRRETLVAMRDRLMHRGPDDEGLFVGDGGRVGLGFRRLRIIDLSKVANQPMSNEDGSVWVAFNGEIYNFAISGRGSWPWGTSFDRRATPRPSSICMKSGPAVR